MPAAYKWLGGVAVVVAGLYVAEDVRGKAVRTRLHREWAARGVMLDPESLTARYAKPGAPTLVGSGLISQSAFDRSLHWVFPVGRVQEYPDEASPTYRRTTGPANGQHPSLDAHLNPPAGSEEEAARIILAELSGFDESLDKLRAMLEEPDLQFRPFDPTFTSKQSWVDVPPILRILQLRGAARTILGDGGGALREFRLALALCRAMDRPPVQTIGKVLQASATREALAGLWFGLEHRVWEEPSLRLLAADLSRGSLVAAMAEAIILDAADADSYLRHGISLVSLRAGLCGSWSFHPFGFITLRWNNPASWGEDLRTNFRIAGFRMLPEGSLHALVARCEADLIESFVLPDGERPLGLDIAHIDRFRERVATRHPAWWELALAAEPMPIDAFGDLLIRVLHFQQAMDLASLAVALERYRLAQGRYPDTLDALVPAFLPVIPADRFDPARQPVYRPSPDGGFHLHAIGPNRTDDGGISGTTSEDGDVVWKQAAP